MQIGPIQVLVIGFENNDKFMGETIGELEAVRGGGVIRVLDLLFVMKDEAGNITAVEDSDLCAEEEVEIGKVISLMLGLSESIDDAEHTLAEALTSAANNYGLTIEDIAQLSEQIEPGTSAGILLIEHSWAVGLKEAIKNAGGYMLAQGFLTPEALFMVGAELQAVAEAESTIEMAEAVKGAALLDALRTVAEAEAIEETAIEETAEAVVAAELVKTAIAADVVRTLIVADLIEDAAAQEAIEALVLADLIQVAALEEAEDAVAQAEVVLQEALAAYDADSDGAAEAEKS